jgi:hypothetical protein
MKAFKHRSITPDEARVYNTFEKVGLDYKGPFACKSHNGETGFCLFFDYGSGYLTAYLVKTKSQVFPCMKDFKLTIVERNGFKLSIFQSDGDSVVLSEAAKRWVDEQLIIQQTSAPYAQFQNGGVERAMQTVCDKVLTVMADYNPPPKFWGFAVLYVCYVLNRVMINIHTGKTPYESVFHSLPDISTFQPFYVPGVYHVTKKERQTSKWQFKAEPCRMLGFVEGFKNTYAVLNVRFGNVVFRRDVVFDESLYTWLRNSNLGDSTFDDKAHKVLTDLFAEEFSEEPEIEHESLMASASDADDSELVVLNGDYEVEIESAPLYDEEFTLMENDQELLEQTFINVQASLKLPDSPSSIEEALLGPHKDLWYAAILAEVQQIMDKKVFEIAENQFGPGMKVKLVLKTVLDSAFQQKFKARLVVCGYSQRKNRDYFETFSPTLDTMVLFMLLHICGHFRLFSGSFDVSGAFLIPDNDAENYAWLPAQLFGKSVRVKVLKSWYGEKQAPMLWHIYFRTVMLEMGFSVCPGCPCLFLKCFTDGAFIIVAIFVDDGKFGASTEQIATDFLSILRTKLEKITVRTAVVSKYVGLTITHDRSSQYVSLNQSQYILTELRGNNSSDLNQKITTPLDPLVRLEKELPNLENVSLLPIIGKVRYIADRSRHALLTAAGIVATGGTVSPSNAHCKAAQRMVDYLCNTANMELRLGGSASMKCPFAMCDSNFGTTPRCRLGGAIWGSHSSGAMTAYSKQAERIALSSMHSEFQSAAVVIKLVIYLRMVMSFLGFKDLEPTRVYMDNVSAIQIANTLKDNKNNSPLIRIILFIRECINRKLIVLCFVRSPKNVADVLTKPLIAGPFAEHEHKLQYGFDGPVEDYVGEFSMFAECDLEGKFEVIGDMNCFYSEFTDLLCDGVDDDVDADDD